MPAVSADEEEDIFKPARFELMEKLVHSDAVTNVVDLEQRMKNERRIVIKNREISLQKMAERHSKELKSVANADMTKIESRHCDDRKRIEAGRTNFKRFFSGLSVFFNF